MSTAAYVLLNSMCVLNTVCHVWVAVFRWLVYWLAFDCRGSLQLYCDATHGQRQRRHPSADWRAGWCSVVIDAVRSSSEFAMATAHVAVAAPMRVLGIVAFVAKSATRWTRRADPVTFSRQVSSTVAYSVPYLHLWPEDDAPPLSWRVLCRLLRSFFFA